VEVSGRRVVCDNTAVLLEEASRPMENISQNEECRLGMLRHVALVKTDVTEGRGASIIRVTRIGELETLAVTSNRRTQRSVRYVPKKRRFLQGPRGITFQKTAFFIVTAVKTSNLILVRILAS
jgi:hypothetical protein